MSEFNDIRSNLLTKYNVNNGGSSKESKKEKKTADDSSSSFMKLRSSLLDKYSPDSTGAKAKSVSGWADKYNAVINGVKDYTEALNGGYTTDASGGFGTQIDELLDEYEGIKDYADRMGLPNANRYAKQLEQLKKGIADSNAFMAQFSGEDEYNEYVAAAKDYEAKVNLDLDAAEKEIADLESKRDDYYWNRDYDATKHLDRVAFEKSLEEQDALINQKKQFLNQARHIQEGIKLSGVSGNEDFKDYSGYVSTRDESLNKLAMQYGLGYDQTYEYINNQNGVREEIDQYQTATAMKFREKGYDQLTEEEVGVYNYYYAKEGREKAQAYLDSLQETLNQRRATAVYGKLEDRTALEIAFGAAAGLDQFKSGVENLFNTQDDYIAPSVFQMASQMVRKDLEDVGPKLPDWMGGASLGQAGYDAVTTTANMAPSIMTSMAANMLAPGSGAIVGNALMFASSAGNAYQEALQLGYDKKQARAYSTLVGGSEAGLQYLLGGIGSLGGKVTGNALTKILNGVDNAYGRVAIKLLGNMLSEGMEESVQEVLTPWFKNLTAHAGEEVDWNEVAYSGLLGAFTAFIMEGGSTVSGEVNTYKTGNQLKQADISAARLAEIGRTLSADTVAYQLAGRVNENTGAYTMGRLFNEIDAEITEQNKTDIQRSLERKGVSGKDAKVLAESFAGVVAGAEFTDSQRAAIEMNDVLARTVQEVIIDPNSTVNQRSSGYREVMMALAKEVAGTDASRTEQKLPGQADEVTSDKVVAQKEQPSQPKYEASESGETADKSTGETVEIREVASIKDGKMTLNLADGRTVDAADISYSSEGEALVYETVADMGVNAAAANVLVKAYYPDSGVSPEVYAHGIREAYRYGQYNYPVQEMAKGPFSSMLTEQQRRTAYRLGQLFSGKEVAKQEATVRNNRTDQKSLQVGKVHFDGDRSGLTDRQKASISALETVADALGIQIHVFESQVDESGKRIGKNGWYDTKDGSIHIDLHAGATGEGTMLFTAAHELTHFIKQWSPAKFKTLANFLMKEYGQKGVSVEELVQKQIAKARKDGRTISDDVAYEEVIADSMETMLADGNIVEKLAKLKQQDKTLWQKIKDFISDLAKKIRKVYDGLTPDSEEGRYVAEMKDAIERLQEMFSEALVEASENYQAAQDQKNTAEDGGVRHSIRESFYSEIDAWDGKSEKTFTVGNTSNVLKSLGAKDARVIWHSKKIARIMREHTGMTRDVIKQVPQILEQPIVVLSSKQSDSRLVMFGTVTDSNGIPVTAILELQPTNKGGQVMNMNIIASAYGKDNTKNLVESSGLVYLNPDKNKTKSWMQGLGLQLPSDTTALGSIGRITYPDGKVKIESIPYSQYMQNAGKRYSDRPYSYESLTSKPDMVVTTVEGNVPKNRADVVFQAKRNAAKVGKFNPKDGSVSVHVKDINRDVVLGTSGLKHSLDRRMDLNAAVTLMAGEILQNSIQINELTPQKAEAEESYVLIGAARSGNGELFVVRSVVNRFSNELASMDVLYAINAKKGNRLRSMRPGFQGPVTDSTISISDLLDYVNQYFPDILPEDVLKHYGHDARPEGKLGESALYQDRESDSGSNRSLLANAFEGLAQNDIEKNKIREYKEKIAQMNAEEENLRAINAQLKKETDPKAMKELQLAATQAANRINIYDSQLLRLEATKPLQNVLTREKKAAYDRGVQKGEEALDEYMKRTEKQQQEIIHRYQQSRDRSIKNRQKAEMRKKIRKTIMDLDKILNRGNKKKNVKEDMKDFVADALETANILFTDNYSNEDMVRNGVGVKLSKIESVLMAEAKSIMDEITNLPTGYEGWQARQEQEKKLKAKLSYRMRKLGSQPIGDKRFIEQFVKDRLRKLGENSDVDQLVEVLVKCGLGEKITREDRKILNDSLYGKQVAEEIDPWNNGVFARERARLNETQVSKVLGNLADSYARLQNSEYAHVQGAYHEAVHEYLKMLQEDIGGTVVRDMRMEQLEELYKAYTMVMTTVQNANRMFAENLNATRDALAGQVMREVQAEGGKHGLWTKAGDKLNSFFWNNLKPVYAFERIGSNTLKALYGNIRKGQDTWANNLQEANAFRLEMYRKHKYGTWDLLKRHKFTSASGIDFELNLGQIMSIYAYSKREQAHDHLLKGGFVFDGNTEIVMTKKGIKRTFLQKDATAYNLSLEILDDIISKLTPEQKAFVDDMQEHLSTTMGNKGNEVSMRLYGVKLFNEKFYFPLKSAGQYMERVKEADLKKEQGQINIANSGFSKATKIRANNPVVLSEFMDVWASHVNDMSMYHAFVLPMEDFRRVYNYSSPHLEEQQSASVNGVIQNAYGSAATEYIDQLYRDLNGGAIVDSRENLWKNMVGKFKKAAVFASASVTIQQPSAVGRAFAYIAPKYFIGGKVDAKRHKLLWQEVKKYAPVAFIKEMGYFDTGMGQSVKDYLTSVEYTGMKDKVKAMFSDEGFRDEALGKLPGLADEITWCAIWEAVKRETKDKYPEMNAKSEEFLKIAGDRFSEVIDKTQVYDSVLARSANMRSKGALMSMATSFMAEPTTSINMLEDALRKLKGNKADKKYAKAAIASVFTSVFLNSVLVSFVYAARDDDEDETYLEKYTSSFVTEMLDGINPVTYYPFLKDVWSSLQGYDIERADMSLITAMVDASQKLFNVLTEETYGMDEEEYNEHLKNCTEAMLGALDSISSLLGIPIKNVRRDIKGGINLFRTVYADMHDRDTSWSSTLDELQETMANAIPIAGKKLFGETKAEKLYDAVARGDTAYADRLKKGYKDEDAAISALTSVVKDRFMKREMTAMEATNQLFDFGVDINDAMWKVDEWQYQLDTGSAEGYSKYKQWFDAIEAGEDLEPTIQKYLDGGVKKETLRSQITDHFKPKYKEMSDEEREAFKPKLEAALLVSGVKSWDVEGIITEWDFEAKYGDSYDNMVQAFKDSEFSREEMRNILMVRGVESEEADKKLNEWEFAAQYGFSYEDREAGYKDGLITAGEMRQALMTIGGKTREEADQLIEAFEYLKRHPEVDVYASRVVYWQRDIEDLGYSIEDTGMSLETYLAEYDAVKDFKADTDENGNSIPYSKINKAFPYINSLNLTPEQKTALAVACGWGLNTVNKNKLW